MQIISRRKALYTGGAFIGFTVIGQHQAQAISFGKVGHFFQNVASTVVHTVTTIPSAVVNAGEAAVHAVVEPAVKTSIDALEATFKLAGHEAGAVIGGLRTGATTIEHDVGSAVSAGVKAAVLLHANAGFQFEQVVCNVVQAATPLVGTMLGSGGLAAVLADPIAYLDDNSQQLFDQIGNNPIQNDPVSVNVPAGGYQVTSVGGQSPGGSGVYPALVGFAKDVGAVQGFAQLLGLFLA